MSAVAAWQQIIALQYPWFARRSKKTRMLRIATPATPCSSHTLTPSTNTEDIRKQIVGLVTASDSRPGTSTVVYEIQKSPCRSTNRDPLVQLDANTEKLKHFPDTHHNKLSHLVPSTNEYGYGNENKNACPGQISRIKTTLQSSRNLSPKVVRFRVEEKPTSTFRHKSNGSCSPVESKSGSKTPDPGYEIRGNAINLKKEGLRGILAYKDLCAESERRTTSFQASLKIFRRRIKLNKERFIQPHESTQEDYVVHPPTPAPRDFQNPTDDTLQTHHSKIKFQPQNQKSNIDHVKILRSALANKRSGLSNVKQSDSQDIGDTHSHGIKCSYRLPENSNWSKEVSFKDVKDETLPMVKTYVLEEDNTRLPRNGIECSVSLTSHNLDVHNAITSVHEKKVKFGENEISCDPRFIDWLQDSSTISKPLRLSVAGESKELTSMKLRVSGRS